MPSTTKRLGADPSSTTTTTTAARDLDRREHSPTDDDHLQHTATSTTGREEDEDDDDDYTSSSGSSDSDSDSDDDEEEEEEEQVNQKETTKSESTPTTTASDDIPRIRAIPKPRIHRINKNPDLLSRLSAFLPQMKSANEKLEQEIAAGRGKDVRLELDGDDDDEDMEGKRYIEMNLGLGVLEEKRPGDDDEEDNVESKGDQNNQHVLPERPKSGKDSNVLDTLMGNADSSAEKEKPTIEEI
ncbi:hypothetical protein AnigIFM50267_005082 [Aspergillus niger]|nr:hypothetical protein AnigIFM50267_005082 [Aspergillus niger]